MSLQTIYPNYKFQQIGSSNNSTILKLIPPYKNPQSALKVISHSSECHTKQCFHLYNEHKIITTLKPHPNIIKVKSEITKNHLSQEQFKCFFEVQLAQTDFLGILEQKFPELVPLNQLKKYFLQIAYGLRHIHKQGVAHNDLKLENILLDGEKCLIADFGFARRIQDKRCQRTQWERRCVIGLAPEILQFLVADGEFDEMATDIFALGILIFSAVFLRSPVEGERADSNDEFFKFVFQKDFQKFWKINDFQCILNILQTQPTSKLDQFKDLIQKMIEVDPLLRIDIDQVIEHAWFQE